MDVRDLRWFQQVADGVTLTEISDLDFVSQSGVSRALRSTRPPQDPTLRWLVLGRETLLLGVGPAHSWAEREQVDLAEAADEVFVATHPMSHLWEVTKELCRQAGFTPRVGVVCEDLPTTRAFVASGLGVAVFPVPDAWVPTHEGLHVVPIVNEGAYRDIGITWSAEQPMLPSAQLFLDHAVRAVRGPQPPG